MNNDTGSPQEQKITVRGILTASDLRSATLRLVTRSWPLRILFVIGCGCILAGMAALFVGDRGDGVRMILIGCFWVALPFGSWWLGVAQMRKNFPYVFEEAVYEFGTEGFAIVRPSQSVTQKWSTVHSVVEFADYFAIFVSKARAYPIPKRFLRRIKRFSLESCLSRRLRPEENGSKGEKCARCGANFRKNILRRSVSLRL